MAELACTNSLSLGLHGAYSIHLSFSFQPAIFFLMCLFSLVLGNRAQAGDLSPGYTLHLSPDLCGSRV